MKNIVDSTFSSEIKEKLYAYGTPKSFKAGDVILNEKAYIKSIPIVLNGNVKVTKTDNEGRELLLYYIQPGESCIMSFLGGLHNDTSKLKAVAEDDSDVLFIPVSKLGELIKEYPEWLDYVFQMYHKRFEDLLDVVNAVAFKKMDERLLNFIQTKCELAKNNTINITHEQMANELGTARVVVSRLLKQMEEAGLVKLGRNKILLV